MRGDITLKILEAVKEGVVDTSDFLLAFITADYGASSDMINKRAYEISSKRERRSNLEDIKSEISKEDWKKINARFRATMSRLEKDGLLEKITDKNKAVLKVTKKGEGRLLDLNRRKKFNPKRYKSVKAKGPILFTFDIPEAHRKSREWIRCVLVHLGFKMVQRSVWVGEFKIPEEFLVSLRELGIIQFIEVIEITKSGTLKNMKL